MVQKRTFSLRALGVVPLLLPIAWSAAACGASFTDDEAASTHDASPVEDAAAVDDQASVTQIDGDVSPTADVGGSSGDAAEPSDASTPRDAAPEARAPVTVLGSAATFAVFSGATITNATPTTVITGNLGTAPSTAAIGPSPPSVAGSQHLGDAVATAAASALSAAYASLLPANLPCGTPLTGDLGGMSLVPGVYCFGAAAEMTGTLTLDAQNNPDAVWVFQIGAALTTATAAQVVIVNGTAGQVCNAYWQVTASATLGTSTAFGGNILANSAITIGTGASIAGRAFGLTALVSMDTNVLSNTSCAAVAPLPDAG